MKFNIHLFSVLKVNELKEFLSNQDYVELLRSTYKSSQGVFKFCVVVV